MVKEFDTDKIYSKKENNNNIPVEVVKPANKSVILFDSFLQLNYWMLSVPVSIILITIIVVIEI